MSPRHWHDSGFNRNALRWHDLLPLRDIIDQKTAPVDAAYDLVFGDGPEKVGGRAIDTGYTDFDKRRCWVNTEIIPNLKAADAFSLTTFVAAHERAHARWTDFVESDFQLRNKDGAVCKGSNGKPRYDGMLHQVWNILEDERIERLLGRDFPHLHRYLMRGSQLMLDKIPLCAGDDDPSDVITWVLRRRVANRAGKTLACPLSPQNQALLVQCEPLIDEAFGCSSSRRVVEIAREILEILKLDGTGSFTLTILSGQVGERADGDAPESDGATESESRLYAAGKASDLPAEIEEMLTGIGYGPDVRRGGDIDPAPYADLLREVMPYVAPLRHLFQIPPSKRSTEYEESGARLSIRALKRTPKTPFRVETPPTKRGRVALTMVIDDSGSMGGNREHQAKLTALLCNEALTGSHKVRAVLAPSGRVAVDGSLKEMSRAFLAGYDSSSGTEYAPMMRQELAHLERLGRGYTRYLILVADGASADHDLSACRKVVDQARKRGIHTFGIGIELDTSTSRSFESIFGAQYVDLKSASELPNRMQAILRRVAHNKNHRGVA
jgi:hypothetical protein